MNKKEKSNFKKYFIKTTIEELEDDLYKFETKLKYIFANEITENFDSTFDYSLHDLMTRVKWTKEQLTFVKEEMD